MPELTIEPGAVQGIFGNLIAGTFDVSTAAFTRSFPVSGQDLSPRGVAFSNDGAKMFVVGDHENNINEYALSAPFELSTAAPVHSFNVSAQDSKPEGVAFSNDGTKMFVVGDQNNRVNEYTLSIPFNVTTAAPASSFHVSTQDRTPTGVAFSNDGAKMFMIGKARDYIHEYDLSVPFKVSTAAPARSFNVSAQDKTPEGVAFSNDGAKMFVVGNQKNSIHEYVLPTPFDVSAAEFAHSFPVAKQDGSPTGMAFSNDGAKMFVVGLNGRDINEYALSSAYPIVVTDLTINAPLRVTSSTPDGTYGHGDKIDIQVTFAEPASVITSPVADRLSVIGGLGDIQGVATFQGNDGRHYALALSSFLYDDILSVVDVTDPTHIELIAVITEDDVADDFELRAVRDVATVRIGSHQYALIGTHSEQPLKIFNVTDPAKPKAVAGSDTGDIHDTVQVRDIVTALIDGRHYAIIGLDTTTASALGGLLVVNITDPANPSTVHAQPPYQGYLADTTGSTFLSNTVQIDGGHYMLVHGDVRYVRILNITDPASPQLASRINVTNPDTSAILQVGDSHYAVIARGGALLTVDITDPAAPSAPVTLNHTALQRSFEITIATIGERHYALTRTLSNGVIIFDVTDPARPAHVGVATDGDLVDRPLGIAHTQIGERHYMLVSNDGFGTPPFFSVIDITDPANPVPPDIPGIPNFEALNYAGSVRITQSGDTSYALVGSGEGIQRINITDPTNPLPAGVAPAGTGGFDTLGTVSYLDTFQTKGRQYALAPSFSKNTLTVIDVTGPSGPTLAGSILNGTDGFRLDYPAGVAATQIGDNHYALVVMVGSGLAVVDVTDPASPTPAGSLLNGTDGLMFTPGYFVDVATIGGHHYALLQDIGTKLLYVVNVTDPSSPALVSSTQTLFTTQDFPLGVTTTTIGSQHYALLGTTSGYMTVVDITLPSFPNVVAVLEPGRDGFVGLHQTPSVFQAGNHHYAMTQWHDGFQIVNLTNPADPRPLDHVADGTGGFETLINGFGSDTAKIWDRLYAIIVSQYENGIQIVDITDPANPYNPLLPRLALDLDGDGRARYVGSEDGGHTFIFQYEVAPGDHTLDLSYLGTGALMAGRGSIVSDGGIDTVLGLPSPGLPDSLSHAKQIRIYDGTDPADHFVTTWEVPAGGQITFPGFGNYVIYWGDGDHVTGATGPVSHTYERAGTYTVEAAGGLERINLGAHPGSAALLRSVEQWGSTAWTSMAGAFQGAAKMAHNADDSPDLSGVINAARMFQGATLFDGDLDSWDVSAIEDMSDMFRGASFFDGDLSGWNVSSVTDMSGMFRGASSFDGDLSSWDVSWVADMSNMFLRATSFDQNLGNWYVVPADTAYDNSENTLSVTTISAQNTFLDAHSRSYGIGIGDNDSNLFNITDSNTLMFKSAQSAGTYTINVTASGTDVFEAGNNWRLLEIRVTGQITDTMPPPTFVSSELDSATGVLRITFSETIDVTPAANVDTAKIHIRESGNYTGGGITLTAAKLGTTTDANTISF